MCVHSAISNRLFCIDAGQSRAHRRTRIVDSFSSLDSDAHVPTGIVFVPYRRQFVGHLEFVAQSRHDKTLMSQVANSIVVAAGSLGAKAHPPGRVSSSDAALQPQPPAPARKPGRPPGATNKKGRKAAASRIIELSVTIGRSNDHLDIQRLKPLLTAWCEANCIKAFFGVEKGENLEHLHFQGVLQREVATGGVNTLDIKHALYRAKAYWPKWAVVRSRQLKGSKLQTWHGMLGYCSKDKFQPHYETISIGEIDDKDMELGADRYCQYGAGDLKKKAVISGWTLWERCNTFRKMKMNALMSNDTLAHVLLRMHRTGKYYPVAQWIVPSAGRGMVWKRFESAWKMIVNPAAVQLEDVLAVYWAMDKEDLRTIDFAKGLHSISGPTALPELHVSEGVLASPAVDGHLNDMLMHTDCAKGVAAPQMLPREVLARRLRTSISWARVH